MVKCPYCGNPAMTLARKSGLGPGRTIDCAACGKPVTTHPLAIFAAVPAFVGGFLALRYGSLVLGAGAVVAGVVAMALIQTFVVPLVRSDSR